MNSYFSPERKKEDAFSKRPDASVSLCSSAASASDSPSFDFPFRLILGSRSPRRRQLLTDAGYRFAVLPAADDVEEREKIPPKISPTELVSRLAFVKARDVVERLRRGAVPEFANEDAFQHLNPSQLNADAPQSNVPVPFLVISCDSVAVCNNQILGKPRDRADAERMLRMLSGSLHEVRTGLCLWSTRGDEILQRVEISRLKMEKLSKKQLEEYLSSELWVGKAGAFGYQDGVDWLELISGSKSNVVGLPLEALAESLKEIKTNFKNTDNI